MKKRILKSTSLLLILCVFSSLIVFNPVNAAQSDKITNMITIAENELGYLETTYDDGSFYSKYGDWYGYPNGAWCAMFVSWCADKANISPKAFILKPPFPSRTRSKLWNNIS